MEMGGACSSRIRARSYESRGSNPSVDLGNHLSSDHLPFMPDLS
jgi:hypothetical protein